MNGGKSELSVSPYRLLFNRRSWYVIGRSSLHRQIRTFNIGRILAAEMLTSRFKIPERFSLDRYLGNAWSLIRDRKQTKKIVIRFQKLVAQNVAEVQWHKTQKLVWNDDETLDFHVTVDGMDEIMWWILGYGDQAEVLEPPELRELIFDKIQAMQKVYKKKT
ncbi:MAG: WYL domain-containing protein [Planctomycetes bacterium]|nr:WYL domain-containing protein [Planctomycetota bacterium]